MAEPGDIVVDMDLLAQALTVGSGVHDYSDEVRMVARGARRAAVRSALQVGQTARCNVWVVHSDPSHDWLRQYRIVNARFKVLDPGRDVCLSRLSERPAPVQVRTKRVIDEYYNKR
jgi:hypothetical protein